MRSRKNTIQRRPATGTNERNWNHPGLQPLAQGGGANVRPLVRSASDHRGATSLPNRSCQPAMVPGDGVYARNAARQLMQADPGIGDVPPHPACELVAPRCARRSSRRGHPLPPDLPSRVLPELPARLMRSALPPSAPSPPHARALAACAAAARGAAQRSRHHGPAAQLPSRPHGLHQRPHRLSHLRAGLQPDHRLPRHPPGAAAAE